MAFPIKNEAEFICSLTEPTFYYKTKHFLNWYFSNTKDMFIALQHPTLIQKWKYVLKSTDDMQSVFTICDEMYDLMFNTGEYQCLFNMFNTQIRKLFGGMFGMNCDYLRDIGIDDEFAYNTFNFEKIGSCQKIQLLMCWQLFWGNYGKKLSVQMANYTGMWDDLYSTISMSKFTGYYLEAIDLCYQETPQWIVSTVVNIILHAFKYINYLRKDQFYSKLPGYNTPMWREYYNDVIEKDPKRFSMSANELLYISNIDNYNERYMETLIPSSLLCEL